LLLMRLARRENALRPRRTLAWDPVDLGDLLVWGENSHRDRVAVDIQAKMDRGEVRDTGHGRLLPYVGSARSVWVTHVDADWSRPFHADEEGDLDECDHP
jgi:hypothetical protein